MEEFLAHLEEVFGLFGEIRTRRMFGGYGIYHDELMFALVGYGELYLKADEQSAPRFEALGLEPFEYSTPAKTVRLSYYRAPEEIFDDPEVARDWAQEAYAAAVRSRRPRRRARKPGKRTRKRV